MRGDFAACAIGMLAARNMAPPEEMRVFNTLI
jgi:hypothetical protein